MDAVFPTLTILNFTSGSFVADLPVVVCTVVLATVAVPNVIHGLNSHLHARARLLTTRTGFVRVTNDGFPRCGLVSVAFWD